MKKILFTVLTVTLLSAFQLIPSAVSASGSSPTIAGVYALPSDLTAGAPETNYKIKIRTIGTLAAGTTMSFYVSRPSTAPTASDFDFSAASLEVGSLPSDTTLGSIGFNQGFSLTPGSDLSEGTYEFALNNVMNATTASDYVLAATTDPVSESAAQKFSPYFALGNDAINSAAAVQDLTITSDSSLPGSTSDVMVSFVTDETITSGNSLYFYFDTASYNETTNTAYDLTTASYSSNTVLGTMSINSRGSAAIQLTADLPAAAHSFTLSNVTHPADSYYFVTFRLSGSPNATTQDSGAYVTSADFDVTPDDVSDNTLTDQSLVQETEVTLDTPTKLKVKNLARRSATVRWSAVDDATFYKVQLRKKNSTVIKTFKHVEAIKKNLTKQWLKAGKTYKFRVKACTETACSAFSGYKKFTTNQ